MTPNRSHAVPWGLLGAAAAVLAAEACVARLDLDLTRPENCDWRQAVRAASQDAPGRDVLCFGTSMVQQGVLPEVIERGAGLRAHNMGIYSGRAVSSYFLLRRALASGARPSAVLVDFHPAFLGAPYLVENRWSDLLGFWDCVDLSWTVKDARFFASTVLDKAVPSIYQRLAIRKSVLDSLRGSPQSLRLGNLQALRNHRQNKGALVGLRNPSYRGGVTGGYQKILVERVFRCCPAEESYLHRFLALAAAHGVRVYWVVMPLTPALQQAREARGVDAEYTRFVRSFRKYPNLVVIDGRRSGYDHPVFVDACHLDPQGGFVLSSDVAEILRRGRGRGSDDVRWVNLPPYRDRPIDVPLENALQSQLAVKRGGSEKK